MIRKEFTLMVEKYGLRELGTIDKPVLKQIVYANDRRAIQFYLDIRDGYLDAQYADATNFDSTGNLAAPAIRSAEALRSVYVILKTEGVDWPDAYTGLYAPGRLEQAIKELISGIERHSDVILGQP